MQSSSYTPRRIIGVLYPVTIACTPPPASDARVTLPDAGPLETDASKPSPARPPRDAGGCTKDDDCIVTNQTTSCCPCCGVPPRVLLVTELATERKSCSAEEAKCVCEVMLCKPTEEASVYRAVCDDGQCRAVRR